MSTTHLHYSASRAADQPRRTLRRTTQSVAACAAALVLAGAAAAQDFVLTVEGTCPGEMTARVTGAPGAGPVALLFSQQLGRTVIPPPHPCAGAVLDLDGRTLRVVEYFLTDESGAGSFTAQAPSRACGGFLQAVDGRQCQVTNTVQVSM